MKIRSILRKALGLGQAESAVPKYEFGMPLPMHSSHKQRTIADFRKQLGISVLVETGTYRGAMIDACLPDFEKIYSIEVDKTLAADAVAKYHGNEKVKIIHGDSGVELKALLKQLDTPTIFWLDGHYSGGITGKGDKNTPVIEELNAIFAHPVKDHLILIDDARCFIGEYDYPSLFEIYELARKSDVKYLINVKDDIIRIGYKI